MWNHIVFSSAALYRMDRSLDSNRKRASLYKMKGGVKIIK